MPKLLPASIPMLVTITVILTVHSLAVRVNIQSQEIAVCMASLALSS
ncbi:MAG: hypothetical protein OEL84_12125 [Nitrosopumilus sp.]|nr:hypothetical protein [Nitrosopumilus sp.]